MNESYPCIEWPNLIGSKLFRWQLHSSRPGEVRILTFLVNTAFSSLIIYDSSIATRHVFCYVHLVISGLIVLFYAFLIIIMLVFLNF